MEIHVSKLRRGERVSLRLEGCVNFRQVKRKQNYKHKDSNEKRLAASQRLMWISMEWDTHNGKL